MLLQAPILPNDFFLSLRDLLRDTGRMATAAALLPASKALYGVFSPVIDYSHLVLCADNVELVLWGILAGERMRRSEADCSGRPRVASSYPRRRLAQAG